jgi:hypothetical protein
METELVRSNTYFGATWKRLFVGAPRILGADLAGQVLEMRWRIASRVRRMR